MNIPGFLFDINCFFGNYFHFVCLKAIILHYNYAQLTNNDFIHLFFEFSFFRITYCFCDNKNLLHQLLILSFLGSKNKFEKTCCLLKCYEIFFQEIVENVKSKNLHKNLTACLHRKKNQRI